MIISVGGQTEKPVIYDFVENLPALDSRHLRNVYNAAMPTINLTHDFACEECGYMGRLEVPFTAEFFWPEQ